MGQRVLQKQDKIQGAGFDWKAVLWQDLSTKLYFHAYQLQSSFLHHTAQTSQPLIQGLKQTFSPTTKKPRSKANHYTPSGVKADICVCGAVPPLSHVFHGVLLN